MKQSFSVSIRDFVISVLMDESRFTSSLALKTALKILFLSNGTMSPFRFLTLIVSYLILISYIIWTPVLFGSWISRISEPERVSNRRDCKPINPIYTANIFTPFSSFHRRQESNIAVCTFSLHEWPGAHWAPISQGWTWSTSRIRMLPLS